MTLKQYLEVYKKPLSESAMNVVSKLAEVEVNKKKIKGGGRKAKEIKGRKK
jgi:CRISPR/Cas system Type II protein with McrA/HNH and RuvC-like nuclease domain